VQKASAQEAVAVEERGTASAWHVVRSVREDVCVYSGWRQKTSNVNVDVCKTTSREGDGLCGWLVCVVVDFFLLTRNAFLVH
jgi:hypothetical protein